MHASIVHLMATIVFAQCVAAGLATTGAANVAVYWGQNSFGDAADAHAQQRLSYYCSSELCYSSGSRTTALVIVLAFLTSVAGPPVLNIANAGTNCSLFAGTDLPRCPQLEYASPHLDRQDIQVCQREHGKTILLSIGGATYTEGGFGSASTAAAAADRVWAMFGPPPAPNASNAQEVNRPFGVAVVDGFDLDFESPVAQATPFAARLRALMDSASRGHGSRNTAHQASAWPSVLSAAPQCPYPDVYDKDVLASVAFDMVMVQFYNNYCGLPSFQQPDGASPGQQVAFNLAQWDTWARTVSMNRNVRVLVGVPGGPTAAGSGYVPAAALAPILAYARHFRSFGGIAVWDMSQVYANPGFLKRAAFYLRRRTPKGRPYGGANGTANGAACHTGATAATVATRTVRTTVIAMANCTGKGHHMH